MFEDWEVPEQFRQGGGGVQACSCSACESTGAIVRTRLSHRRSARWMLALALPWAHRRERYEDRIAEVAGLPDVLTRVIGDYLTPLDESEYGEELALQLASKKRALRDLEFFHSHRDYCGDGLYIKGVFDKEHDGQYARADVHDGLPGQVTQVWETEEEFVAWLARQSDRSLRVHCPDGYEDDNQRITRSRIERFLADKE